MRDDRRTPDRTRTALFVVIILLVLLLFGTIAAFFYVTSPPGRKPQAKEGSSFRWVRSLYGYGDTVDEQLSAPMDAEFDASGNVYVVDQMNARIMIFTSSGAFRGLLHKPKPGQGQIARPSSVSFGPDGDLYVTDTRRSKVIRYRSNGDFVAEWDEDKPTAARVVGDKVYVAAWDHVSVFTDTGELIRKFGERGREPGKFDFPHGIDVGDDGSIWVADGNNSRIQHFKSDGTVISTIGEPPKSAMDTGKMFGVAYGLELDGRGHMILSDPLGFEFFILDLKGKILERYEAAGSDDGMLSYPSGISYDPARGLLVVADTGNDRAQVFEVDMPGSNRMLNRARRWALSPLCYGPLLLLLVLIAATVVTRIFRNRRGGRATRDASADVEV